MKNRLLSIALSCSTLLIATNINATQFASPEKAVDTIYYGGPIVTLNDKNPSAQAVAVKNGRIVAVGSENSMMPLTGKKNTTNILRR